jgi:hypothetical protein
MKLVLFAATLMLSGAAIAQTQPETTAPDTSAAATTTVDTATTTDTTATTMTTTATMPSTGMTVAPGNTSPERDARGIPVISSAATAPPGVNIGNTVVPPGAVAMPNQAAAFQTQAATTSYPACSRTVTDQCVQNYERGRPR